jgi:hypothetical protein
MKDRERRQLMWIWSEMKSRCHDPRHKQYKDYGGRGIGVCPRWMTFANFLADMGPRPKGLLLDRIDNNGDYEPWNCRWATRQQQNSNRRNCIYVVINGERITLKEACRRLGLKYRPVHKRIKARGWTIDRALSVPIGKGNHCAIR